MGLEGTHSSAGHPIGVVSSLKKRFTGGRNSLWSCWCLLYSAFYFISDLCTDNILAVIVPKLYMRSQGGVW